MTKSKIEKRVKFLTYYSFGITILLTGFIFWGFTDSKNKKFEEIDVKRVNVVEPDGQNALVLANSERLPGAIINGDTLSTRGGIPGVIFYNSEGDETGGLIFDTRKTDSSRTAFGHLSFDRYKQDQTLALQYVESSSGIRSGLRVLDRPKMSITKQFDLEEAVEKGNKKAKKKLENLKEQGKMGALRVFVGTQGKTAALRLHDKFGNERIRVSVDSADTPQIKFFNKDGEVTNSLPPQQ